MKKLFLSAAFALICSSAALASDLGMALGVQLNHGSYTNQMGLGVKYQMTFEEAFRIEPSFNYYFKNNTWSTWDVNFNAHYLVNVVDRFNIYPLVGLNYSHWAKDLGENITYNQNRVGANIGAGAEFSLTDNIAMTGELKYMLIKDYSQLVTSIGVKYCF